MSGGDGGDAPQLAAPVAPPDGLIGVANSGGGGDAPQLAAPVAPPDGLIGVANSGGGGDAPQLAAPVVPSDGLIGVANSRGGGDAPQLVALPKSDRLISVTNSGPAVVSSGLIGVANSSCGGEEAQQLVARVAMSGRLIGEANNNNSDNKEARQLAAQVAASGRLLDLANSANDEDDAQQFGAWLAGVEALPAMLHRNYSLMRELDKSLQGVQLENEQRCQQEIEDIKHGLESGSITYDLSKLKFSDETMEEQKHCVRIADEKVALATQTYDLVDAHIQQLDQFMRKLEEQRQEKEAAAAAAAAGTVVPGAATATAIAAAGASRSLAADAAPKSGRMGERGRGGRKKAKMPTEQPAIDLELPVDPNEPTYCLCNQVSYGEMVACDNPDCKIEWFHFGCVGLKEQPKGKWYCPSCGAFQKKRKGK